jgi:DNA-binding MarR family transcriptional regulator
MENKLNPADNSLYEVFARVIRLHYHRSRMLLDEIGVYPGQPPMLFALQEQDSQSQTELANKINISPATVTVMLNHMEKEGLIKRSQDPDDQRVLRVYLTEKGKSLCRKVKETLGIVNSECFSNFTEKELLLLRRFFIQMHDNLKESIERE